jgi:Zn-dependent protease with chaperone function
MEMSLGLLQLALLSAGAFSLLTSFSFSILYRCFRPQLLRLAPPERAQWLFGLSVGPMVVGILLTAVCFLPSVVELAAPGRWVDHCLGHDDHHAHLCLLHPPLGPGRAQGWAVLAGGTVALGLWFLRFALKIWRSQVALRVLVRAARRDEAEDIFWISGPSPIALLAGFLRPRLILSEALRERLSPRQFSAVVLHERAHAARRDVLRLAVASAASLLHLPWTRRAVLEDLRLACEQAADARAADALKDPLCIAETILAVARLLQPGTPDLGLLANAFGANGLAERIHELLSPSRGHAFVRPLTLAAGALLLMVVAAGPLHHLAETALTPFTR